MKRFVFLKIGQGDFDRGFDATLKIASPDRASFIEVEAIAWNLKKIGIFSIAWIFLNNGFVTG